VARTVTSLFSPPVTRLTPPLKTSPSSSETFRAWSSVVMPPLTV
jgi:hypothetical protein